MGLIIRSCYPDGGAFKYILTGLGAAFQAAGASFTQTQSNLIPNDFNLYLGSSGWRQTLPSKHNRMNGSVVGIHVNPYGPTRVGSVMGGPAIDESANAIEWTLAQKPDFVFCYCAPSDIPKYYGYWNSKHNLPIVSFPTAADITVYRPYQPRPDYICDIAWVGGYWPYKSKTMDIYLMPLRNKYNCKLFGWSNNFSSIADGDLPILYSSAKICPSISEPHTMVHPIDLPERVFKVIASGGFTVHTSSPAIRTLFGDVVPTASDQNEWFKLIDYYLHNNGERIALKEKQRAVVLDRHTYFDRAISMVETIAKINPSWNGVIANLKSAKKNILSS